MLLHTLGQARLKDNKRDREHTSYTLLPIKFPFSVLKSSHEDKQKKYSEAGKQSV